MKYLLFLFLFLFPLSVNADNLQEFNFLGSTSGSSPWYSITADNVIGFTPTSTTYVRLHSFVNPGSNQSYRVSINVCTDYPYNFQPLVSSSSIAISKSATGLSYYLSEKSCTIFDGSLGKVGTFEWDVFPIYSSFSGDCVICSGYYFDTAVRINPALNFKFSLVSVSLLDPVFDELVDSVKDQTDYLKDDTPPSSDLSSLGVVQGFLPPGPVDSLLNLPFTTLSIINSSLSGSCSSISAPLPFLDQDLVIPCFNDIFYGSTGVLNGLLNWIGVVPCAFILLYYFKHLYKKIDRAVSMSTNSDDEWGVI